MSLVNPKSGGISSTIMREFINKMLPVCPLCGSREPLWVSRYSVDLLDGRIQFRCSACDSAISITQTDFLGVYKLRESKNIFVHLYTWPITVTESIKKKMMGKEASIAYVKIEELGFYADTTFQKGKEVPLQELQRSINRFR